MDVINIHVPLKRKYIRANHVDCIDKELSQTIKKHSKLRNDYLKYRSDKNRSTYKKQRNFCVFQILIILITLT